MPKIVSELVPGDGMQVVCRPRFVLPLSGLTFTQVPKSCSRMP